MGPTAAAGLRSSSSRRDVCGGKVLSVAEESMVIISRKFYYLVESNGIPIMIFYANWTSVKKDVKESFFRFDNGLSSSLVKKISALVVSSTRNYFSVYGLR